MRLAKMKDNVCVVVNYLMAWTVSGAVWGGLIGICVIMSLRVVILVEVWVALYEVRLIGDRKHRHRTKLSIKDIIALWCPMGFAIKCSSADYKYGQQELIVEYPSNTSIYSLFSHFNFLKSISAQRSVVKVCHKLVRESKMKFFKSGFPFL